MSQLTDEMKRAVRVTDQSLSAHRSLRSRLSGQAFILDVFTFALATILCALLFLDPEIARTLFGSLQTAEIVIGFSSAFLFLASIIPLLVNWKGTSALHEAAAAELTQLKADSRTIDLETAPNETEIREWLARYHSISRTTIPIPESAFLVEKQKHLRKIALSKEISRRPFVNLIFLKISWCWRDTFRCNRDGDEQ